MLCPRCDGEIETTSVGEAVCTGCGVRWNNIVCVCGEKYRAAVKKIADMVEIEDTKDVLRLLGELKNIEAAYAEAVDELTTGVKI